MDIFDVRNKQIRASHNMGWMFHHNVDILKYTLSHQNSIFMICHVPRKMCLMFAPKMNHNMTKL